MILQKMKEFEVLFKSKNSIITQKNEVSFQESKIVFDTDKESCVQKIRVFVKSDNYGNAEKQADEIIKKFNNLHFFFHGFPITEEKRIMEEPIKNITDGKRQLEKIITLKWNIEGYLNTDFKKYYKCKNIEKLDRLLSIFGDSFRVHDKELKFLCFYKVISNFGSINHNNVHEWLIKLNVKTTKRVRKDNGQEEEKVWPVNLRAAIMYDENPDITKENLKNMEGFAKKFILDNYFKLANWCRL